MASIFSKIINGEIKGTLVHEDEHCAALVDIHPKAPTHILIVPKKEIESVATASADDKALLGHLMWVAAEVARKLGLEAKGYRLVTNIGGHGGQTVPHLHIHLLGGRQLDWPPG